LLLRGALLSGIAMLSEHLEAVAPGVHTAYIDPGSGALALQLLGSVLVGLLFYVKRVREYLGRCWEWLLRRKRN
jgi:hypothetical protein